MTDIAELVRRLRASDAHPLSIHGQTMTEAADALEAQAKGIKIYQQTELTYVTRVADGQREYSEMQAKLEARIAELKAENEKLREAMKFYSCSCDIEDKRSQRCGGAHDEPFCGYVASAALNGEMR